MKKVCKIFKSTSVKLFLSKSVLIISIAFAYHCSIKSLYAQAVRPRIPIQFKSQWHDFDLNQNCQIELSNDSSILIQVINDTRPPQVELKSKEAKIHFQNKTYFYQDSVTPTSKYSVHFFKDNKTNKPKQWFVSENTNPFNEMIFAHDQFIYAFYKYEWHKNKIAIANIETGEFKTFDLKYSYYLGFDGKAIYFYTSRNIKLGKINFKKNSILVLKGNEIFSYHEPYMKKNISHQFPCFLTENYKIQSNFWNANEIDGLKTTNYYHCIYYMQNAIDSVLNTEYYPQNIEQSSDTLTIMQNFSWNSKSSPYFRMYKMDSIIYQWDYNSFKGIVPELQNNSTMYIWGEILLVKTKYLRSETDGINSVTGLTKNGLKIGNDDTGYYLVTAFDLRKNRFLGYPTITY